MRFFFILLLVILNPVVFYSWLVIILKYKIIINLHSCRCFNLINYAINKELYLGGSVGLKVWKDEDITKAKANEAGYIHKLYVRRKYSGIGLSKKMVEFAIEECKKRNIKYLRLDTGWTKKKLCNLYKSLGFELVGKTLLDDSGEFALFEVKIKQKISFICFVQSITNVTFTTVYKTIC